MRILKPLYVSAVALATLASCDSAKTASKSVKNLVIEMEDYSVSLPAKKAALTEEQANNWMHADLATDTIPGMSTAKAYAFLEGKKSQTVIVGVVDSGSDLEHEDLKGNAWVNEDEIPGNNKDDDKNGYVDDIHGWNFLGDSYKEYLEYQRIIREPELQELINPATLAKAKKLHEDKVAGAKQNNARYQGMLQAVTSTDEALTKHFGTAEYTKEQVMALETEDAGLLQAKAVASQMYGFGLPSLGKAKTELTNLVTDATSLLNGDVLKPNYREVVGDNPNDIKDTNYGDNKSGHHKEDEIHGTHVTGIIGAVRNNGIGMDGVANNVKLMAVRSVPDGDEYDKDVALGIRYAVDNGAKVINTSFGKAFSPNKKWVWDAIKYAADKDVLIVNAAGNSHENIDVIKTFPNDSDDLITEISDNFITIGAMSSNFNAEMPAPFSNYGKLNVDIFAPGVDIYASFPDEKYESISGTSMASPATAGVAAMIRSYYPTLSAGQVKKIIMASGTKIDFDVNLPQGRGAENQKTVPFTDLCRTGKIVNAYRAVVLADKLVNGN